MTTTGDPYWASFATNATQGDYVTVEGERFLFWRQCGVTLGTVIDADADALVGQLTLQPGTGKSAMQTYGFPANGASNAYLQFYGTSETLKKCSLSASRSLP